MQLDQVLSALQAPTRKRPAGAAARALDRASRARARAAYNRSIPYWKPAYRDSAIVADALQGTRGPRPRALHRNEAGETAAALDRNRDRSSSRSIVDFDTTAATLAAHDRQLSAAVAELPRTLSAADAGAAHPEPPRSRPCGGLIRDARPAVRSTDPTIDASRPVRQAGPRPRLRARAARALARPAPARAAADDAQEAHRCRSSSRSARRRAARTRSILPWTQGHDRGQDVPRPAARSTRRRRSRCPASPARAAPATPTASGSGSCSPRRSSPTRSAPTRFFFTGQPLQGVNPPVPQNHKRSPLRPDVPCETQQPPDLRTIPRPAPQGFDPQPAPSLDQRRSRCRTPSTCCARDLKAAGPRPQGLRRAGHGCRS